MINKNTVSNKQISPNSIRAIDTIIDPTWEYSVWSRSSKGKHEKDEWAYTKMMIDDGIAHGFFTEQEISRKRGGKFKFLDRRYIDKSGKFNVSVLVEIKSEVGDFTDEEIKQLFAYVKYEKYLRKGVKIIALLVNTETEKIRIWKIDGDCVVELFDTKLKSYDEYKNYFNMKTDTNNNKIEVLKNATELNKRLHNMGIKEHLRCQFVGLLMLALKNGLFYGKLDENGNIIDGCNLTTGHIIGNKNSENTIIGILNNFYKTTAQNVDIDKISDIMYSDVVQNQKTEVFCELLEFVNKKIMAHINAETNEGLDILSSFFLVFLKYVNREDKNQAFTPDHIAKFMAKIGGVNKNSVVLDPTCGSGTFLIAALNIALSNCDTEEERIHVKKNIYGVEVDENVYKLATSNMLIHSDGYSNVEYGSCFEKKYIKHGQEEKLIFDRMAWIKDKKPTVILMNPPYNASKAQVSGANFSKYYSEKAVTDPLKGIGFVEEVANAAGTGKLVVLLPQQCAIGNTENILNCKERILKNHTLDAVFTMPNDLFYPGASAVVCCMVFELGKPHSPYKETFLGYYKDDGFEKRKYLGRVDVNDTWDEIESEWLSLYENRKTEPGKSITKKLTYIDEWCAEAHMESDYNSLYKTNFESVVKNYVADMFRMKSAKDTNEGVDFLKDFYKNSSNENVTFNTNNWRKFTLGELFNISKGKLLADYDKIKGDLPFISSIDSNNGISDYVDETPISEGNVLTVNCNGSVGEAFYQPIPFWATGDVNILKPKSWQLTQNIGLFMCAIIRHEKYRYSYGRKWNVQRMKQTNVMLPVDNDGYPNWDFMEKYISTLEKVYF